jgi:hypothetical protein
MSIFHRKTEFWKISTPKEVGPGSYNLRTDEEKQTSSAPFSTSEKKGEPLKKSEIGPGSYLGLQE